MKENRPLISVVIPTFNRAYCIERSVNSVLSQTYKHIECIVVDNNSDDDTENLLISIKDPRIKFFKIDNKGVIAKSRNLGIKKANGEYIAFLDSDDWWSPNKLQVCLREIRNGADLVYHNLKIYNNFTNKNLLRKNRINAKFIKGDPFTFLINNGNPIPLSSSIVRKKILIDVGGFNENHKLIGGEDYYLWINLSLKKCTFKRINIDLGFYTINNDSMTSSDKCKVYFKEIFRELYNKKLIKEKKIPSWANLSLSYIYLKEENFICALSCLAKSILNFNIKLIPKSIIIFILIVIFIFLNKLTYNNHHNKSLN